MLIEADTQRAFLAGARGLVIRLALAVNRALGREGSVWGDRYCARALRTPREVRHALVHVVNSFKEHMHGPDSRGMDLCSSGPWFAGWRERPLRAARCPAPEGRTAEVRRGWGAGPRKRRGLIPANERPAPA